MENFMEEGLWENHGWNGKTLSRDRLLVVAEHKRIEEVSRGKERPGRNFEDTRACGAGEGVEGKEEEKGGEKKGRWFLHVSENTWHLSWYILYILCTWQWLYSRQYGGYCNSMSVMSYDIYLLTAIGLCIM